MNAFDLLELLEQQKILSHRVIDKLRQQVQESPREVTADSLAQLLVQKGVLAQLKAQELLQQLKAAPPTAAAKATTTTNWDWRPTMTRRGSCPRHRRESHSPNPN